MMKTILLMASNFIISCVCKITPVLGRKPSVTHEEYVYILELYHKLPLSGAIAAMMVLVIAHIIIGTIKNIWGE